MKAWRKEGIGLENLKLVETETPEPGPRQILVKVKSVSLNFRDKSIIDGDYLPDLMNKPFIPVSDAVGEIVKVGNEVTKFKKGDRVVSHLYTKWIDGAPSQDYAPTAIGGPNDGGLAEYMILEEYAAVMAPSNLSDEEVSTLPIAALTVWFSLVEYGKIKAGDTVLVLGTGGVSVYAIQIASALGARVIVTTSSNSKGEKAKELGASEIINYVDTPNWEEEVLKLTDGAGAQHIIEVVGGESINRSIKAVALQGHIYVVGFLKSMFAEVNLFDLLAKQAHIQGIYVGHSRAFADMNKAFNELNIHPIIDTVYSFNQAIEAYEHLGRGAFGKIVIKVSE
ncbi:zinc-dependent alcohol dehydrogenase family protein [Staphylococcus succinus]|uniref:Alcohol dehydrogenase n=1 Tax=Staphylococcus succinus TaxID=61015 RepID=A0ABX5IM70_9STAP|nr:NAD(P)-dependent alcohol dehydrogenase [Staphylococcus succinus]PTI68314.1 alcohol dehydrogenase [Staphylococcus succinus]RIN34455.1 NAD(P)-dependent alcohol dehydrogenase [Staphylococcus succinus]